MSESASSSNTSRVRDLLRASGLFDALAPTMLQSIEDELESVQLPGGETLFREGDIGDSLYLLVQGRLIASVAVDGEERIIGEISRGQVVGEIAVLSGEHRSATVRASRDSDLVRFSKHAFERVVEKDPQIMGLIAQRLILRLREARSGGFRTTISTIAVIPVQPSLRLDAFMTRFLAALSRHGKVVHLTADHHTQGNDPAKALADYEQSADYVVYQAALDQSDWTQLCIRQADRILLVAQGDQSPQAAIDAKILELCRTKTTIDRELVLLHPESTLRPQGTAQWTQALSVKRHHHLRTNSEADHQRLARILTGHGIGLVLGGGGAKGFAHIGVLRAMAEHGVPIDFIGGTSMGSVIAAQFAAGLDWNQMIDINRKGWIQMDPLRDATLPITALLACRKLDRMIDMMFSDLQIEDLWVKYFCVSANLTRARTMVHQDGPLKKWVRASMAIPGVAVPVIDNGDLLVDGGVLNNVPGDVMQKISGGNVIVVDVTPRTDLTIAPGIMEVPSSWEILASRFNPLKKAIHIPTIVDIMMRVAMLASIQSSQKFARSVDLYLCPPIDEFGMFDWKSLTKLADAGYAYAQKMIPDWWAQHTSHG